MNPNHLTPDERAMLERHIQSESPTGYTSGPPVRCGGCHRYWPCDAYTLLATIAALREQLHAETMTEAAKCKADASQPLSKQITNLAIENATLREKLAAVVEALDNVLHDYKTTTAFLIKVRKESGMDIDNEMTIAVDKLVSQAEAALAKAKEA